MSVEPIERCSVPCRLGPGGCAPAVGPSAVHLDAQVPTPASDVRAQDRQRDGNGVAASVKILAGEVNAGAPQMYQIAGGLVA
jgi:hypothetical protein